MVVDLHNSHVWKGLCSCDLLLFGFQFCWHLHTQRICINEIKPSLIFVLFVFLYILAANCTSSHKNSNHQQGERQLENAVTHSEEMNDETLMSYRDRITDTNELVSLSTSLAFLNSTWEYNYDYALTSRVLDYKQS